MCSSLLLQNYGNGFQPANSGTRGEVRQHQWGPTFCYSYNQGHALASSWSLQSEFLFSFLIEGLHSRFYLCDRQGEISSEPCKILHLHRFSRTVLLGATETERWEVAHILETIAGLQLRGLEFWSLNSYENFCQRMRLETEVDIVNPQQRWLE